MHLFLCGGAGDAFSAAFGFFGMLADNSRRHDYGERESTLFDIIRCAGKVREELGNGSVTSEVATVTLGPIVAWGNNAGEQTWIPAGVTNPVQVSAGADFSAARSADGSVVDWGDLLSVSVPANLTPCTAIAAGAYHIVSLLQDGSVTA